MLNKLFKIGYWLLFIFLFLIVGMLLFSMFPIKGNYQIKVVQSGSMEPAIKTGSIVVIKPAESYKIGDVITFGQDTPKVSPTTHRIIESRFQDGKPIFRVKGDANEDPDPREIKQSEVLGRVLFSVPIVGYVIDSARKPIGFIILIIIPALIMIYDEVKKIWREAKNIRGKSKDSDISEVNKKL